MILQTIHTSPLAKYVTISEEDAGLHFLMKIETELTDEEVLQKLEQEGIKISALSQYYQNPPKDVAHVFIVNYSLVPEENIEKAIESIYKSLFAR